MQQVNKDVQITQSILNFLRAGYLGQIVFHSAMTQLGSNLLDDSYLQNASRALDKVEPWFKEMLDNMPIFAASWTQAETFEAIRAMSLLGELKTDLEWLASQMDVALEIKDLKSEPEALRLLVAGIARCANARSTYLEGAASFANAYKMKGLFEHISMQYNEAQEYVRMTQTVFESFRDLSTVSDDLCERLRREAELVPCDFRSHIHDIIILQNTYAKEFTFETVGFSIEDAEKWQQLQATPQIAGFWRAYKFSPEEAASWVQRQLTPAALAAGWRRAGFKPEEAFPWAQVGFIPPLARIWHDAGFEPERAQTMVSRGVMDPAQAKKMTLTEEHSVEEEEITVME